MIVGTAGHIDHGKTALVRALTGVDTDRLPEEKRRGISIELGYAFLDAPGGGRIGFIDAPGHEKLVHTMIAGASGIDYALLLVAADDGPMPQTREHLAVLSLLGIARGAVIITKADRADAARIAQVRRAMAALLAATPLAAAPVLAVSAQTGTGLDALRALLFDAAAATGMPGQDDPRAFRLAIDRAFSLSGVGTVVTGTIHAGQVAVGDELALTPAPGGQPIRTRARSLHAQNQPVERAWTGQRCAVALAGLPRQQAARGQWLTNPAVALAIERLDARLTLWLDEPQPLRPGGRVQVHVGAAHTPGTVALLDAEALAPGRSARVQLVLHAPVGAWHGERVLLRDANGARTLAGGQVLDPCPPARYRRTPQRLAELAALEQPDPGARLTALIAAAPFGVDLLRLAAAQGWRACPAPAVNALRAEGAGFSWALGAAQTQALGAAALAALARLHQQQPDEPGPDAARLKRLAAPRLPIPLWRALIAQLIADETVARAGACLHLPEHGAQLSVAETRIAQTAAPALRAAGPNGAWVRDLARDAGQPEALVRTALARLARRGELHQVVKDLYCAPETMRQLAATARQIAATHGGAVHASAFRDATGLGRKRAIQILEYFDRTGFTRRQGRAHDEAHHLRPECGLF
ncbi:MAG: selenocysteine-specific translation elongation factor [Burkholderiaceae bacterium]|nr:selenocysteine-specific translation elongation factor [Burkholderiaceae bacterium]